MESGFNQRERVESLRDEMDSDGDRGLATKEIDPATRDEDTTLKDGESFLIPFSTYYSE